MNYALINDKGNVLEVRAEAFEPPHETLQVVKSTTLHPGDEFYFYVLVSKLSDEPDEDGFYTIESLTATRNSEIILRFLQDIEDLRARVATLEAEKPLEPEPEAVPTKTVSS